MTEQQYLKELRERQLIGMENLTQTPEIEKSVQEKKDDLNNLKEATIKFFNNDTTIKSD